MSLINHIIIPVVGSRHNLEEQNVFKHSCLSLTPQKGHLPEPILWKKSMSAFKKFKQKKDKKDKKPSLHSPEESLSPLEKLEGKVKLITKTYPPHHHTEIQQDSHFLDECYTTYLYYDPNEAPLYQFNVNDTLQSATVKQSKILSKAEQFLPHLPDTRMVKAESQLMQEQHPVFFTVQPRPDDPFIIVRKGTLKKSVKYVKSKPIKKQKWEKGCSKDEEEEQSPHKKRLQSQCSNLKPEQKMSEKESSEEEFQKNRQIFTLSQIMKSAQEQRMDEECRAFRLKDPVMRQLKFEQVNE